MSPREKSANEAKIKFSRSKLANSPKKKPKAKDSAELNGSFPIVAIGASAGGLEAFKEFFLALPSDTGMAFVVIHIWTRATQAC